MSIEKRPRHRLAVILPSLFITAIPLLVSALILRNLGGLIGLFVETGANDRFDFVRIFEQTGNARLSLHWILPLLLGVSFGLFALYVLPKLNHNAARMILAVTLFVFLLTAAFVCALMLTRVNGIRFFDLLAKLLPLIDKL